MDASMQVCRAAVRTNYFPLWEIVDRRCHLMQTLCEGMAQYGFNANQATI